MYGFVDIIHNEKDSIDNAFSCIAEDSIDFFINSKTVKFNPNDYMGCDIAELGIDDNLFCSILNDFFMKFLNRGIIGNDNEKRHSKFIKPLINLHNFAKFCSNELSVDDVCKSVASYKSTNLTETLTIVSYLGLFEQNNIRNIWKLDEKRTTYDDTCLFVDMLRSNFGNDLDDMQRKDVRDAFIRNTLENHKDRDPISNALMCSGSLLSNDIPYDDSVKIFKLLLINLNVIYNHENIANMKNFFITYAFKIVNKIHDTRNCDTPIIRMSEESTKESKIMKLTSPWLM